MLRVEYKMGLKLFYLFALVLLSFGSYLPARGETKYPVIYSTDLFHPHGDMDDQVDIAVLYSIPNIELKAIILNGGKKQKKRPGSIPVSQLNYLTGKNVIYALGAATKLKYPEDPCFDQDPEFQMGIELILKVLKESEKKVTIVTVGSLRDIAGAFNRNKKLFFRKVEKLLIFAGEATDGDFIETNVRMDPLGFYQIMNSGLPILWVPCFDGGLWKNNGKASYWQTEYRFILQNISKQILQYFIYALTKSQDNPITFLETPVDISLKDMLFSKIRNLWSCSVFPVITHETIVNDHTFKIVPQKSADRSQLIYGFTPVHIKVSENGKVIYTKNQGLSRVLQFNIVNKEKYSEAMTEIAFQFLSKR